MARGTAARQEPILHNRLAVLRAERGLSRQELAEALGVNYQTIGYLERGEYNPSLALAFQIANYFDLPIEVVFNPEPMESMATQLYGPAGAPGPSGRGRTTG